MVKSFLFFPFIAILVVLLMAPSIETFLSLKDESSLVMDQNEEENNQKENDEKCSEKNFFITNQSDLSKFRESSVAFGYTHQMFWHSTIPQEILSPPPEGLS